MIGLNPQAQALICRVTGAAQIAGIESIQSLWRGYGEILRVQLRGAPLAAVVVKQVRLPQSSALDPGHARKLRSYQVEWHWYRQYSQQCSPACRIPVCYGAEAGAEESLLILEDLALAGFAPAPARLNPQQIQSGLTWLAHFHAAFLQQTPDGLWPVGSYWHLGTRRQELAKMPEGPLKNAAADLDHRLRTCHFQTLIHGDAKRANLCLAQDGRQAMVDFQYVGGGCGIRDVAYFLDSCLAEAELPSQVQPYLDCYFEVLGQALAHSPIDRAALETEWRSLFAVAWTDFYRFLQGWMPGYHSAFSEKLASQVIGGTNPESNNWSE